MQPYLIQLDGPSAGQRILLDGDPLTIGTDPRCRVRPDDRSLRPIHGRFVYQDSLVLVEGGSRGAEFEVDGLPQGGEEAVVLRWGDVVTFGETRFLFVPHLERKGSVGFVPTSRRRARRHAGRTRLLARFTREFEERPAADDIVGRYLGALVASTGVDWGALWLFEEDGEIGEAILRGNCPNDDPPVERVAPLVAVMDGETHAQVLWRREEQWSVATGLRAGNRLAGVLYLESQSLEPLASDLPYFLDEAVFVARRVLRQMVKDLEVESAVEIPGPRLERRTRVGHGRRRRRRSTSLTR